MGLSYENKLYLKNMFYVLVFALVLVGITKLLSSKENYTHNDHYEATTAIAQPLNNALYFGKPNYLSH